MKYESGASPLEMDNFAREISRRVLMNRDARSDPDGVLFRFTDSDVESLLGYIAWLQDNATDDTREIAALTSERDRVRLSCVECVKRAESAEAELATAKQQWQSIDAYIKHVEYVIDWLSVRMPPGLASDMRARLRRDAGAK